MIQALCDKVWANPKLHEHSQKIEMAWLKRDLNIDGEPPESLAIAKKLMQSAAILACSERTEHRRSAFRIATNVYELFGSEKLPFAQALRVVLARLGNFPSFATRSEVDEAYRSLPLTFAAEELSASDARQIEVNQQAVLLTDFQHRLWESLNRKHPVALAAPTSAGKSFVLQNYLTSVFDKKGSLSIVYLVPTRALIAQVIEDLSLCFVGADAAPEIIGIPIDAETALPERAIYVMTQERVQLMLSAHPAFKADIIVADEAQSIADGSRGVLLQWVIDDLLSRFPAAQMLFASPTIRNLDVFARIFGLENVIEFSSIEPTVTQNFLIVDVKSATKGKIRVSTLGDGTALPSEVFNLQLNQTTASRVEKLVQIAAKLGLGHASIVYADGAADAQKIAFQLADIFSDREPTQEQMALSDLARESVHPNYVLSECVKRGVAFHYANIPTQLRRAIETAVANGHIDFLVCTSTLLQGVNLPIKNIFMCQPKKGKGHPLEATDFWNLSGRAGRLRREFQGNIFLIDYSKWDKKPLEGERNSLVVPAIEESIGDQANDLTRVINDQASGSSNEPALETAFVRLYSDLKQDRLATTLSRVGVEQGTEKFDALMSALKSAEKSITLPASIIRLTPNVSAHKQQRLFNRLEAIVSLGIPSAQGLIPRHPRENDAFQSYADVLEICYEVILGIDTTKGLHRFHALMAMRWMQGMPLPQIIDNQIKRDPTSDVQTTIRKTLDLIEEQIRFQAVRLFGCYNALLVHALSSAGMADLISSIPSLPLYLEVGASDKTMISFISLGLSRVTAMKLNDLAARKDLDTAAALQWLRSQPLDTLGLSPLLLAEVKLITQA